MTDQEQKVLDQLANAWNEFLKLPLVHNDELPDFRKAIHDAQRIIMARPEIKKQKLS